MEHHTPSNPFSAWQFRIPVIAWVLGAGLLIALAAIFVFDVPISTVGYYAIFAVMMGSHFFMHRGHGGHSGHNRQGLNQEVLTGLQSKDEHETHSGDCH